MKMQEIERILTFAIEEEKKAAILYRDLAAQATDPGLQESLLSFAAEEEQHKALLENVMIGDLTMFATADTDSIMYSEECTQPTLSPETMTLRQALRFAITAEQKAFRLYMTLARAAADAGLTTIFEALAKQEAAHAKRFENLFDQVMVEN